MLNHNSILIHFQFFKQTTHRTTNTFSHGALSISYINTFITFIIIIFVYLFMSLQVKHIRISQTITTSRQDHSVLPQLLNPCFLSLILLFNVKQKKQTTKKENSSSYLCFMSWMRNFCKAVKS